LNKLLSHFTLGVHKIGQMMMMMMMKDELTLAWR